MFQSADPNFGGSLIIQIRGAHDNFKSTVAVAALYKLLEHVMMTKQ